MSVYRKFIWCKTCDAERMATVDGEISFPPPYAIGAPPGPDVVKAKRGECEGGHPLSQGECDEILNDIAAGDVF